MRAVVTGGAGFIGSKLVKELVLRGYETVVIDDLSTGSMDNLTGAGHWKFFQGHIETRGLAEQIFEKGDVVFHLAAIPSIEKSMAHPMSTHDVNVTGTLQLLEAARKCNVARVVFASSSSVYGDYTRRGATRPLSVYAASKLAGEAYCRMYERSFGLETVVLRYFNVYGSDQKVGPVIPNFVECKRLKTPPIIYGDGEQLRDFTHVSDVVNTTATAGSSENISGMVFDVGTGICTSLNQIVKYLGLLTPLYRPSRPGDVQWSQANIRDLRIALNYRPSVVLSEWLAEHSE